MNAAGVVAPAVDERPGAVTPGSMATGGSGAEPPHASAGTDGSGAEPYSVESQTEQRLSWAVGSQTRVPSLQS